MEQYLIKGGTPLVGCVEIGGAKNSALGILAAAIMCDEDVTIRNLPDVDDINIFLQAIESIGAYVDRVDRHTVIINGNHIRAYEVDNEFIRKIRASYYLVGALLGKYGEASVALPGGCNIGSRPIDLHMKGFRKLNAQAGVKNGMLTAYSECLTGGEIYLDSPSVGATINIMLAASRAKGKTIIRNAAKEPHIVDVAQFLNQMGANIKDAGNDDIRITGVSHFKAADHDIIPDQIEAGTFMCAAAAVSGSDVKIKNIIPQHLKTIKYKLQEMGAIIEEGIDEMHVMAPDCMKSTRIETMPYPGFPTDMQAQFGACLSIAEGTSTVTEKIFENRFKYIDELTKMGGAGKVEGKTAVISGVKRLSGAIVSAPDLRAGAALVIAGLTAEGYTCVENIQYVLRGYEDFDSKLRKLNASIYKINPSSSNERDGMIRKLNDELKHSTKRIG